MKKLHLILPLIGLFFVACNQESVEELEDESTVIEDFDFVETYIYKGKTYILKFKESEDGSSEIVSEIPEALNNIDNLPELSTVLTPDATYLFDNEREEFEYFNQDYDLLLKSRIENENNLTARSSLDINAFNDQVRCYEHNNFTGRRMYISAASDLKNLRDCNFNDIMSSTAIYLFYQSYPPVVPNFDISYVKFYEHSNWSGRTRSFRDWTKQLYYPGGNGRAYIGHQKFRDLRMTWNRTWADKVTSIDVINGGVSIVR